MLLQSRAPSESSTTASRNVQYVLSSVALRKDSGLLAEVDNFPCYSGGIEKGRDIESGELGRLVTSWQC
jgi:hypothetical protein